MSSCWNISRPVTRVMADNSNRGAGYLMRASDLDLRTTKNELFSKLIERKQMIVTTTAPNRTTSDENLNASSLQTSFKSFSEGIEANSQRQADAARKHFASLFATKLEPAMFSRMRSKWYTNEEVASILTSYVDHPEWQSNELQMRPKSGAVLLYSREKVRYRQDGYCWKKRKNGRTTREDHMKLKVQGIECIYGCYVHSALLPTFHRRCYWLLENPDIVLVHYLNQPPDDKNNMMLTFNPNLLELDTKRRWTNEEIIEEIGSVFGGISEIHHTLSINFPAVAQTASQSQRETPAGDDVDNPCSPVTQIYNKIVEDIETYAIPLELNQFEPNHHHHLHQQKQQQHLGEPEVQSMDTSEPNSSLDDGAQKQFIGQQQQRKSYSSEPQKDSTSSGRQLISCDLFASCGHLADDNKDAENTTVRENDMLLAQLELSQADNRDGCVESELDNCPETDEAANQVDEMGDLMMGIASNDSELTDANNQTGHHHNQLLLACQDTSDPLESLFGFKSINCESIKTEHQNRLLDVKSTTSETADSLLNRLSPIVSGRQPPRCNSSDDAMQLSSQRLDQYLHHTSINFLATTNNNIDNSREEQDGHLLVNDFCNFDRHHSLNVSDIGAGAMMHESNVSTEQSNSTSTSSLLNAASSSGNGSCGGGGYLSTQSADQGPSSSSGSNYNESSATSSSSYIKLPLQQRQNSEQREPSNSFLNSLLPKAFSLDGSELSSGSSTAISDSHSSVNMNAHHNMQLHDPQQHHHQYHGNQHHHHHQRTSPLIGPYHTTGSHHSARASSGLQGANARSSGSYGQQQQQPPQQSGGHMLLVPAMKGSTTQHQAPLTSRHHYQRPSAPAISPSTGAHSLDSSSAISHRVTMNQGGSSSQYHSGSVVASTTIGFDEQQRGTDGCDAHDSRTCLLPILDYVPNWSPTSGGIKILLIGQWRSLTGKTGQTSETRDQQTVDQRQSSSQSGDQVEPSPFYVLFDQLAVPATLIQDNVLRCFSPQHKPGFIALKVLFKSIIVSEQVLFEIRHEEGVDTTITTPSDSASRATTLRPAQATHNHDHHYHHHHHQAAA